MILWYAEDRIAVSEFVIFAAAAKTDPVERNRKVTQGCCMFSALDEAEKGQGTVLLHWQGMGKELY